MNDPIQDILEMIFEYGGIDGEHHKQWLLNEIVKKATISKIHYEEWVKYFNQGEDGPETYEWEVGVAP